MTYRIEIPRDNSIDASLAILREGYQFIPNRRRRLQSDIFSTRLFGNKVICISGPEAAEIFYNEKYFMRKGAAPKRIQKSLFGKNGVQSLDGKAHEKRKNLFMSLFSQERMELLKKITKEELTLSSLDWADQKEVNLFLEMKRLTCIIACKWTNVPLNEHEVDKRASDLWSLVDSFGAAGGRHWRGRLARISCEKWIERIIENVPFEGADYRVENPLEMIANHRDVNGDTLPLKVLAVELLNILRPIVAISLYIVFGILAIHSFPMVKQKLLCNHREYLRMFVQEVRRYYPFTPFVGARVRNDFFWNGHDFKKNTLVLLDIYGMNHDHRIWGDPSEFRPERFENNYDNNYTFIPQGGGNLFNNHRCAGELVTISVMEVVFEYFIKNIAYSVPKQDLRVHLVRMPPKINSSFIIKDIEIHQ